MQIFPTMIPTTQHKEEYNTALSLSSSSTCGNISVIPTDIIIYNILVLIEPKTLTRLRCSSKWWNTLISGPAFSLIYYRFRSQHELPHQIYWDWFKESKLLFLTTDSSHSQYHNTWTCDHPIKGKTKVSDSSCLGLICLYGRTNACIYNPTTQTIVVELPLCNEEFDYYTRFVLGFVPSTNQFKVICFEAEFIYGYFCPILPGFTEFNVLTVPEDLNKGWRKVASPLLSNDFITVSANAEGAIYFVSYCCEIIFRFDLEREIWSNIKFPTLFSFVKAVEFRGYFRLVIRGTTPCYVIWMLRDGNVWVKEWVLNESPNKDQFILVPLHYDEKRGRLLIKNAFGELRWYWIKKGTFDKPYHLFTDTRIWSSNIPYVETLVSLKTLYEISLIGVDDRAKQLSEIKF